MGRVLIFPIVLLLEHMSHPLYCVTCRYVLNASVSSYLILRCPYVACRKKGGKNNQGQHLPYLKQLHVLFQLFENESW
jgi:hypothetical protein